MQFEGRTIPRSDILNEDSSSRKRSSSLTEQVIYWKTKTELIKLEYCIIKLFWIFREVEDVNKQ